MQEADSREPRGPPPSSFARTAIGGSLALSTQWFLNKICTVGSTIIIAYFLKPEEYGVARTALSVLAFLMLPPLVMGDVLIARARRPELWAHTAHRLSLVIGGASCCFTLLAIPVVLRAYEAESRVWLGVLLAVLSLRPLLHAVQTVPMSNLRHQFQFRRIALVEGLTQLGATGLSVAFAALGAGPATIVVPQIIREAIAAIFYIRIGSPGVRGRFRRGAAQILFRTYITAAGGQYLHGIVTNLPIIAVAYLAGDYQSGLFGFSFMVAAQANTIIIGRLGVVLQPILSRLRGDDKRLADGFLRAERLLGAIAIPIALLQGALAEPLFRLLLEPKWLPAVPVFQALSVMQAAYFASAPSMSCLKAQRRFAVLLFWQAAHFAVAAPAYWLAIERGGAAGAAWTSAVLWAVSAPVAVWLCIRRRGSGGLRQVIGVFSRPLIICLPVYGTGYFANRFLSKWGMAGDMIAVCILGPLLLVVTLLLISRVEPELRTMKERGVRWIQSRLAQR